VFRGRQVTRIAILALLAFAAACNRPSAPTAVEPLEDPDVEEPAPTSRPSNDHDACLVGEWWSYTHDIDILLATLAPVPNMHVADGNLVLWFTDGVEELADRVDGPEYEYQGRVVLRLDMDPSESQYIETAGFFTNSGAYSTEGDSILNLDVSNSQREILSMQACKNGECQDATGLMPTVDVLPPGSAPYRCTASTLEIDTQGPYGTATMFFYR